MSQAFRAIVIVFLIFVACSSHAANRYVRAGASGANNGTDWTNAYTTLPATLTRGDTYYIADGTYGYYKFNTANSGTTYIYVKKATVADHGTGTGWTDTYGDGTATFSAGAPVWEFGPGTGYYDINGQFGTADTAGSYGFRLTSTTSRNSAEALAKPDTSGLYSSTGNHHGVIFRYVEFDWNNGTAAGGSGATRAVEWNTANNNNDLQFYYCYIHHSSGFGIYRNSGGTGYVVDHSYFVSNGGASTNHHETLWVTSVNGFTFSNNVIRDSLNGALTGWLMLGTVSNASIYGNVFECTTPSSCITGGNGIVATWDNNTYANTNITIVNNTFANLPTSGNPSIYFFHSGGADDTNVVCNNNLIYTASFGFTGCDTASYNAFGGGAGSSGTSAQTGLSSSIFVNWASLNLRLAGPTAAGTPTSFTTDPAGLTRGADGVWDRGAFEYNDTFVHVGATATGSGSGADWNNQAQWSTVSFVRGKTYYLADGVYGSKTFSTAVSGTTYITIKKATALDHGSNTGWVSTLGDGEAFFNGASPVWQFTTSYWILDGAVGAGKATTAYGFHLRPTTTRCVNEFSSAILFNAATITNITWRYLDADWNNGTSNCTSAVPALFYTQSTATADITLEKSYFHDAPGYALYVGEYNDTASQGDVQDRWKIQNNYFYNLGGGGGPDHHFEAFWCMNMNDVDFRYNIVENIVDGADAQTGWLMIAKANGYRIYGNVFFCSNASCSVGGNGVVATWSSNNYVNDDVRIYNNTFAGVTSSTICVFNDCGIRFTHNSASDTNIIVKNNLYYNTIFTWSGVTSQSNEACGGGQPCSGTTQQTGITTGKFFNYAGKDFRLASATNAGDSTIGVLYSQDMLGLTRGADGVWDRGAFEFDSGGAVPASPINLRWSVQ